MSICPDLLAYLPKRLLSTTGDIQIQTRHIEIIILLVLVCAICGCQQTDLPEKRPPATGNATDSLVIEMTAIDSISPLELLLAEHQVEYRSSMMGSFVTAIDSVEVSSAGYWIYKVNDTTPKVACDKMILIPGDRLAWRFVLSRGEEPASDE